MTREPEDVWCPDCDAAPGDPCMTHGTETPRAPHKHREGAAYQATRYRQDPMVVRCPYCGEGPGDPCRTAGGSRRKHHSNRGLK